MSQFCMVYYLNILKKIMLRIVFFCSLFFSFPSLCAAQSTLDKSIQKLLADPIMKHASISMTVMDVETGKTLSSHQPNLSISPASSMKVITTATALAILGEKFQFQTVLEYDGTINAAGILDGNIYIKGFGDPTLGAELPKGNLLSDDLMLKFVTAIQKAGIKKIKGKIIGDASYFNTETTPPSWQWNDIGNYYGAGVSGLNINANSYELFFRQNPSIGKQPKIEGTSPQLYNVQLINEVKTAARGTGDQCYIYGAPYQNTRFLRGTIPAGSGRFRVKGSLPDPAFSAAAMLLETLERQGVSTSKVATTYFELQEDKQVSKQARKELHIHFSKHLFDIAKVTNEESINLYCEAMLKTIGKKQKGVGSLGKGIEAVMEFWKARGVNMDGFYMEDGCGLSARNGISSKHFASILRKIKVDKGLGFDFKETLAVSGKTGTLKRMFKNTEAQGKIFAKTGSMNRIRSYSGYVASKSGRLLSFSIIVNNYHSSSSVCRKKLEGWMYSLVSY